MTILLLTDTAATFAYGPLLAAGSILVCSVIIYLAVKGKLRDWFLR